MSPLAEILSVLSPDITDALAKQTSRAMVASRSGSGVCGEIPNPFREFRLPGTTSERVRAGARSMSGRGRVLASQEVGVDRDAVHRPPWRPHEASARDARAVVPDQVVQVVAVVPGLR